MAWSSSLLELLIRPLRTCVTGSCRYSNILSGALRLLPAVDELSAQGCATIWQLGDLFSAQLFAGEAEDLVELAPRNGSAHDVPGTFAGHRCNPALRAERLQFLLQSVRMGDARTSSAKQDPEDDATHLEPLV